jgi:hypothetical protein
MGVAENVEFVKLKLCITLSQSLSKNKINPCKTNQNILFPLEFTEQEIYINIHINPFSSDNQLSVTRSNNVGEKTMHPAVNFCKTR